MSSRSMLRGLTGSAIGATLLLTALAPVATAADGTTVEYQGLKVTVPAAWRIVDLDRSPGACLRLDVPTLYLGHAGTQSECSGRAVADRADTLHLEPIQGTLRRADIPTVTVESGTALPAESKTTGKELRYELRQSGIMATASYGASSATVRKVIEEARSTRTRTGTGTGTDATGDKRSAAPAAPQSQPEAAPRTAPQSAPLAATAGVVTSAYRGQGFDACTAPSQTTMNAWKANSPYRAVGVYIGGGARACAQPNLTADWVRTQTTAGWHLMPLWVGPQPWNSAIDPANKLDTDLTIADQQGRTAATGAVTAAQALGLDPGSLLYNNVEYYSDRAKFDGPVVAYLTAWTEKLHELGYRSGAYVAVGAGAKALSAAYDQKPGSMPDVLWTANWNNSAGVSDADMGLSTCTKQWVGTRRAHQFVGDTKETYGGIQLNIDRNYVDVDAAGGTRNDLLCAGATLESANAKLTMQADGNLVLYYKAGTGNGVARWATGTYGNPGAYGTFQGDGNFVIYNAAGVPVWASGTYGNPGAAFKLQDDGNLTIISTSGSTLWSTRTGQVGTTLTAGQTLEPGAWTHDTKTALLMQDDGNLIVVERATGQTLWTTGVYSPGAYARMQEDGNLVVYRKGGGPATGGSVWSTGTWGHPGAYAKLQADGNFVVYAPGTGGAALWATGTWRL
ncbi:glycoside hydrolase domain-containing protein [Streptomyces sp. NPDC091268]|uniref:glycoside hydrolase domain-containing protein n=1 Tax=Streptomyces sp. NPDC091268 TaxID=3365979 RepID=UPI0038274F1E